jgi:hypothetical protein
MKTLVRIAVALERIAMCLDRITGTAVYKAPFQNVDPLSCLYCRQRHSLSMPCPGTSIA